MKKLTALILTAVMLVCMTAIVPVSAAYDVIVLTPCANEIEVNPGDEFTLTWGHNPDFEYGTITFDVYYDANVLTSSLDAFAVYANDATLKAAQNESNPKAGQFKNLLTAPLDNSGANVSYSDTTEAVSVTFTVPKDVALGNYNVRLTATAAMNNVTYDFPADAESTIVVKIVEPKPEEPEITVVDGLKTAGGQVRVPVGDAVPEQFGFRFVSTIDATVEAVKYGTLVIPADLLGKAELTVETADAANTVATKIMSDVDGVVTYNATMVKVKDANLNRDFTTRAYAELADGSIVYGATYTTNIYEVAQAAVDAGEAVDYLTENVLNKVAK